MARSIAISELTVEAFAAFGDVIALKDQPDQIINQGFCGRHNDLARLDFIEGRAGISLFKAIPRSLPYRLEMMERHPLGSQAFIPMTADPFLVIVAPDNGGAPGDPVAFRAPSGTDPWSVNRYLLPAKRRRRGTVCVAPLPCRSRLCPSRPAS